MGTSKRLDMVFHNGEPDGVRTCRKHMSVITCYVIPRAMVSKAKSLTGINNPGLYFLINEEEGKLAQVYIGQTRHGINRMGDHQTGKDFWSKAILFLADKDNFTLTVISGLESYAISKANESNRYQVVNKSIPKHTASEFDLPIIEEIYEEVEFIMATLGYKLYGTDSVDTSNIYMTNRRNIIGKGIFSGEKFELLPGSQIDMSKKSLFESYNVMRKTLLDEGSIIETGGKYILQKVLEFNSPSGASNFVLGGSTNGWKEWKNSNDRPLDDLRNN